MRFRGPEKPPAINFDESPIPQVPVEVIRYVMTLPDEVRQWLGNFLLDSTMDGFDGTEETAATLWPKELQRRIEDARAHPEKSIPADVFIRQMQERIEHLRRTPCPDNLHGYHCSYYFMDGWAERGYYDKVSHYWLIEPVNKLHAEQRLGFFAVGGPGVDGIRWGYRYGYHGVWAYYPIGGEFRFLAETLDELVEKWLSGAITV